jgi:hypothetical protein
MTLESDKQLKNDTLNPYSRFLYALKALETKRQYPKHLEVFLKFAGISGSTIEEKLHALSTKATSDS